MWNDVIGNLVLYRSYIVFTALMFIALAIVSTILVRYISWKSTTIKIFGIFSGMSRGKLIALSMIFIRLFFFWSFLLYSSEVELTYIFLGLILTIVLHLLSADLGTFLFDLFHTALIYGELYVYCLVKAYLEGIQLRNSIVAMQIILALVIIVSALYSAFSCIQSIAAHHTKANKKVRIQTLLHRILLLFTAVIMIIVPYYFITRIDTIVYNQDVYQYIAEGKLVYSGSNKITKAGNGCMLENKKELYELKASPLYLTKSDRILLPNVLSIIQPRLSLTNRVENMSEIYRKDGQFFVENENGTTRVKDFFLYDGRDMYLFFEPVTIVWKDQSMDLSPFSYINVKYNQFLEVYDKEKDNFVTINTGVCDVTTSMKCRASINLSTDILYRENGQEQILFLQPNLLEDLK